MGPLTFAMFIRVARTSMDLTQEAFGKKIGLSRANVCDLEKGRTLASPELALKIAKKADLSEKMALRTCLQDQVTKAGSDIKVDVS